MKSRESFEGHLSAITKERIAQSKNPNDEALFLIDTFMAAAFFCTGVIERNIDTRSAMNRMFARAERVRGAIEAAKRKPNNGGNSATGIDGDPIIIRP